ncbi:MAG: 16S rRNA (guanine(527)-N(7))-methyltransferase RsmG [Legionellales bacterium]|jgi:16S rRNA (guanine527-N7)-methyltransferase|nr:16S rRNA (guanine(527)-N(7))-methyltransferase RsmG [Legionellales bacterium]
MTNYDVLWQEQLREALDSNKITYNASQIEQVVVFLNLLVFWNRKHNLTRIRPEEFIRKHVIDSLSLLDVVNANRFLDVGSGAGFPGIPLAIFSTCKSAVLLDSSVKKCGFLMAAKRELNLNNVVIECVNILQYSPSKSFDVVVTRAFASLQKILELVQHTLTASGVIWAMKADITQAELAAVTCGYEVISDAREEFEEARCLIKLMPFNEKK